MCAHQHPPSTHQVHAFTGRHVVFQSGFYSTAGQQMFVVSVQPLQAAVAGEEGAPGPLQSHALVPSRTRVLIDLAVRCAVCR